MTEQEKIIKRLEDIKEELAFSSVKIPNLIKAWTPEARIDWLEHHIYITSVLINLLIEDIKKASK